jgi:hypothetical protein
MTDPTCGTQRPNPCLLTLLLAAVLCCIPGPAIGADRAVPTNTTAQRFSTLTIEERVSYLDGVMDSMSMMHVVRGGAWVCPKQSMAVYLVTTEKAISTYVTNEGPPALLKPAAFYALLAQQAIGCRPE